MIKEAIILAGGLGTRLRSEIGEMPKPLAPINGKPFLHFIFQYLKKNNIETAILSVGYKWEMIHKLFGEEYLGIKIKYAIEKERLGTGGGINLALNEIQGDDCFVLNGDTFFDVDLQALGEFHLNDKALFSLAAKPLTNFDRYGTIDISLDNIITSFNEKAPKKEGVINGGTYCISKSVKKFFPAKNAFSIETEFLEAQTESGILKAKVFNDYFMDIGIPEDYKQFETDHGSPIPLSELKIDKEWTLFLDRDGVINLRLIDDYVKQLNELKIIDGVPASIAYFNSLFKRIVVVTNQQGIGRGMMTVDDLDIIHGFMNNVFKDNGGIIEKFYFAPQLASENSNYRKPGTGMGLAAQQDYPDINFSKCLLIGDSESDIEFGMKLGMKTIMLTNVGNHSTKADYIFNNLQAVATELKTYY
jgi:D-glycero-alpha-D-manno-heptose 1-phosphate guanylyltransferase